MCRPELVQNSRSSRRVWTFSKILREPRVRVMGSLISRVKANIIPYPIATSTGWVSHSTSGGPFLVCVICQGHGVLFLHHTSARAPQRLPGPILTKGPTSKLWHITGIPIRAPTSNRTTLCRMAESKSGHGAGVPYITI